GRPPRRPGHPGERPHHKPRGRPVPEVQGQPEPAGPGQLHQAAAAGGARQLLTRTARPLPYGVEGERGVTPAAGRRPAGCSGYSSSEGNRAATCTRVASVEMLTAEASCFSSGFWLAWSDASAMKPRTTSARFLAAASSPASPVSSTLTCGSRSPVTTRLLSAGSSRPWLVPGPPGPGIVLGRFASTDWSPTIQNVEPGLTPSISERRAALLRRGT